MKKRAFTLAEVLITLVIIGVIAAMTIPTLMGSTNNQELKSKAKKVMSEINQALALEYALYGNNVMTNWNKVSHENFITMLNNQLSVSNIDYENNSFNLSDGTYIFLWEEGDFRGFGVKFDNNWNDWRDSSACNSPEACTELNPNVFQYRIYGCGNPNGTEHRVCPDTAVTYAAVYDLSYEEAFEKSNGSTWLPPYEEM